jgi:LAS superfamily LD-carboxypeptidase LdcB
MMDENSFFGKNEDGLILLEPEKLMIRDSIGTSFQALRAAAAQNGFALRVESAYRSFDRQLIIWNRKANGELPLLDADGKVIASPITDEEELVYTILNWSALPGASRHHFGTEIDVVNAAAIPLDYEVQLTATECETIFAPFHQWLDRSISEGNSFGFDRVFIPGRGKIRPERWHLSHITSARELQKYFNPESLREIYRHTDIACKKTLLARFDSLIRDYVYPYFL